MAFRIMTRWGIFAVRDLETAVAIAALLNGHLV
jgi:hypothetical protein